MIYVMLAEGFEEIEALAVVDVLRRAALPTKTVAVGDKPLVTGAHGIPVTADTVSAAIGNCDDLDAVVLPGGMPGTLHLEQSDFVQRTLDFAAAGGKVIAAICAAPSILGHKGLLKGKRAASYPDFEKDLTGAEVVREAAVWDGNILTSRGPGTAIDFSLALAAHFVGAEQADQIKGAMQCAR